MVNASQDAFGLLAPRQEEIIGPFLWLDALSQLAQALKDLPLRFILFRFLEDGVKRMVLRDAA